MYIWPQISGYKDSFNDAIFEPTPGFDIVLTSAIIVIAQQYSLSTSLLAEFAALLVSPTASLVVDDDASDISTDYESSSGNRVGSFFRKKLRYNTILAAL